MCHYECMKYLRMSCNGCNNGCFHPVFRIQITILAIILLCLEVNKNDVFDQNVECLVIAEQTMVFSSSLLWFYFFYSL